MSGTLVPRVRGSTLRRANDVLPTSARLIESHMHEGSGSDANGPRNDANGGAPAGDRRRCRVLVVDDEPDIGDILTAALGRAGYDVHVSMDDRLDGYDLAATELALVDMYGPRHEGREVIRRVRLAAPGAAVIAMSGDPSLAGKYAPVGAEQVGADAVLTKPFEIKFVIDLCASLRARGARA
jgi:CheY-like chemotaxis protein